jgi:hypothetical protein
MCATSIGIGSLVYGTACVAVPAKAKTGAERIAERRQRICDSLYCNGELERCIACYAFNAAREETDQDDGQNPVELESQDGTVIDFPSEHGSYWNVPNNDRKAQYEKIGAFCAAAIDRLQALEDKAAKEAAQKPRRFKYMSGTGVFNPQTRSYKYLRNDGTCGEVNYECFWGIEWIDAAPLN